jgi:hypothetical protein
MIKDLITIYTPTDELVFNYYSEIGDFYKVRDKLVKEGYKNDLGKRLSINNIQKYIWTYVYSHPEETKPIFDRELIDNGKSAIDPDIWNIFVIKKWMMYNNNSYSFGKFKGFIEDNEFQKYHETFKIRYPEYARRCADGFPDEMPEMWEDDSDNP